MKTKYNGYLNPWVPMIRDAYARGMSVSEIAKILSECGVGTKSVLYGLIRNSVLKIQPRWVRSAVVPEKSWTAEQNYNEIEGEYK